MLKKLLVIATLLSASNAQAALVAGDIAFTSFNADEDGFALATFVDIAANSTIYFSDNEWNGSAIGAGGAFNTGEAFNTWTTGGSLIAAGSVIRFSAIDNNTNKAVKVGTTTVGSFSSIMAIGNSNETIYAYLGTSATSPTTFLTAITNSNTNFSVDGTLVNTGLTAGTNAIRLSAKSGASSEPDFAEYTGSRSGLTSFADYKPLVANVNNWNVDTVNNSTSVAIIPNTTAFTTAAIPEPETYAMFLAGLGLFSFASRRKQ